jgi:large subunit ribosomal protein L29
MKNKDIKKMTTDELNKKVNLLKKDLFNIRFKKVNGQLQDTAKILILKKDVAKMLTKLNLKKN